MKKRIKVFPLIISLILLLNFAFISQTNALTHAEILDNFGHGIEVELLKILPPWYNHGPLMGTSVNWPDYMYTVNEANPFQYQLINGNEITIVGTAPKYIGAVQGIVGSSLVKIDKSPLYSGETIINWKPPVYFGGNTKYRNFKIEGTVESIDENDPNYVLRFDNYYNGYKVWNTWDSPPAGAELHLNYLLPIVYITWSFYIKRIFHNFYQKDMVVNIVPDDLFAILPGDTSTTAAGVTSSTTSTIDNLILFAEDAADIEVQKQNNQVQVNNITWESSNTTVCSIIPDINPLNATISAGAITGESKVSIAGTLDNGAEVKKEFEVAVMDATTPLHIGEYITDQPILRGVTVDSPINVDPSKFDFKLEYTNPNYDILDYLDYSVSNMGTFFILNILPKKENFNATNAVLEISYTNDSGIATTTNKYFNILLIEPNKDAA